MSATSINSAQQAWFVVHMAMMFANDGRISRAEAEDLMNAWFDRCEHGRRRMFPDTELA